MPEICNTIGIPIGGDHITGLSWNATDVFDLQASSSLKLGWFVKYLFKISKIHLIFLYFNYL